MSRKTLPLPKKKKTIPPLKGERPFLNALADYKKTCEARARIANAIIQAQDPDTREAIERIADRFITVANGIYRIRIGNGTRDYTLGNEYVSMNAHYLATQVLNDLALMDIRVANFKFSTMVCAECGAEMKPKKKRRR